MAYVTVPKDLTKVKSKVMFGLTKRQLVCFGAAALIGVPLFFLLRGTVNSSTATVCMIVVMLPLFLLAMYEKDGQPLEVYFLPESGSGDLILENIGLAISPKTPYAVS